MLGQINMFTYLGCKISNEEQDIN